MPRGARLDAPGTLHHVMVRGIERRNIVDDEKNRQDFVFRLGKLSDETGTAIYAWALMPNHARILLRNGLTPIFTKSFKKSPFLTTRLPGNRHPCCLPITT